VRFRYGVDARYAGQGNEVTVWVGEGDRFPADPATVLEAFEREYARIFGLTIPDVAIEVVTWRLAVTGDAGAADLHPAATGSSTQPIGARPVVFGRRSPAVDTPVYRRAELAAGARFDGPAIIEERETTAVIRPGWNVIVSNDGSLIATRGGTTR
jgi:N-methylhydantoinase A